DTLNVARELLGAHICRRLDDGAIMRLPVTEVEAYVSAEDRACHASRGRTPRTQVMFGPAGRWYIYLCYGMYWMINIVTMHRGH
ncbi:MAG: DNA-3-methyladenine glycosylase, partial [Kiritimatiellia bacterium]